MHLPPCPPPVPTGPPSSALPRKPPPPPSKHPVSIIAAHTTALTTLSLPPSGRLLATTSSRGTLVRVWDALSGKQVKEFRRGTDKADIYGVAFRPDERELCVWSDKGTVHVFTLVDSGASYVLFKHFYLSFQIITRRNRQSSFSPLAPFIPLPRYFESEWSYAQYRIPVQSSHISISASSARSPMGDIPDEERCVVGWVETPIDNGTGHGPKREHQLIALTYTGGWYRLSLPQYSNVASSSTAAASGSRPPSIARPRTSSGSSVRSRSEKGKEKERDKGDKGASECVLQEFRRFGRWDGWG